MSKNKKNWNKNNYNNNNRYLYSAFSKAQSTLQHFVGDLARLLFTGANCSHAVYNLIIVTVGFIGAPRTEQSDRPPHRVVVWYKGRISVTFIHFLTTATICQIFNI